MHKNSTQNVFSLQESLDLTYQYPKDLQTLNCGSCLKCA